MYRPPMQLTYQIHNFIFATWLHQKIPDCNQHESILSQKELLLFLIKWFPTYQSWLEHWYLEVNSVNTSSFRMKILQKKCKYVSKQVKIRTETWCLQQKWMVKMTGYTSYGPDSSCSCMHISMCSYTVLRNSYGKVLMLSLGKTIVSQNSHILGQNIKIAGCKS